MFQWSAVLSSNGHCSCSTTNLVLVLLVQVLYLFSDNFDYQNLRRDFVGGVLSEEELGNKLYVHELQVGAECYVSIVLQTYSHVSHV